MIFCSRGVWLVWKLFWGFAARDEDLGFWVWGGLDGWLFLIGVRVDWIGFLGKIKISDRRMKKKRIYCTYTYIGT